MRFEETLGISHLLRVTEHELRQKLDRALGELDLTYPQYAALSGLEANESISNADLARRCFVKAQTMNKVIENLEENGLVKKASDPENAVRQRLRLSLRGKDRVCRAHVLVDRIERIFLKEISFQRLKAMLETGLKNLQIKNLGQNNTRGIKNK